MAVQDSTEALSTANHVIFGSLTVFLNYDVIALRMECRYLLDNGNGVYRVTQWAIFWIVIERDEDFWFSRLA